MIPQLNVVIKPTFPEFMLNSIKIELPEFSILKRFPAVVDFKARFAAEPTPLCMNTHGRSVLNVHSVDPSVPLQTNVPPIFTSVPTYKDFPIPTPPATCKAPVVVFKEFVTEFTAILPANDKLLPT